MGPRLEGRGNLRQARRGSQVQGASMGPRLEGRGNKTVVSCSIYQYTQLQWGRVLKDAEM